MIAARVGAAIAATGLIAGLLTGCGGSDVSAYCDTVVKQREHLSEVAASTSKDAAAKAIPALKALKDKAPLDIRVQYGIVIAALDGFKKALASADNAAIKAAATVLASSAVSSAMAAIEQEVRDVCHTPLTL